MFNSDCQLPRVFFILVRPPPSRNLVGTPFCTDGLPIFQRFLPSCVARTSIVNLVISVVHKIQFSLFRVFEFTAEHLRRNRSPVFFFFTRRASTSEGL